MITPRVVVGMIQEVARKLNNSKKPSRQAVIASIKSILAAIEDDDMTRRLSSVTDKDVTDRINKMKKMIINDESGSLANSFINDFHNAFKNDDPKGIFDNFYDGWSRDQLKRYLEEIEKFVSEK